MFSLPFSRSTAICRNAFGYHPTRLFATPSSLPSQVCQLRVSQFKGFIPDFSACEPDLLNVRLAPIQSQGSFLQNLRQSNSGSCFARATYQVAGGQSGADKITATRQSGLFLRSHHL